MQLSDDIAQERDLSKEGILPSTDFEQLSQAMEQEFLALGDRLCQFRDRSRTISEKASEVGTRMTGSDIVDAIESLHRFQQKVGAMESNSIRGTEALAGILERLKEIDRPIESLGRIVNFLDMISVIVKIENARLIELQTGFGTTAQNLKELGTTIRTKTEDLGERTSGLAAAIRKNLLTLREKEQHQNSQARLILDQILTSMEPLREKRRISADILHHLSVRYQSIFKSIGDIVSSLQFHDITRQRIEHSTTALKEIEKCLAGPIESSQSHSIAEAIAISRIQSAQLRQARADLKHAAWTAKNSLNALALEIQEIIHSIRNLAGLAEQNGESFLSNIERNLSSLQLATKDYVRRNGEISTALAAVAGAVDDISSFADDIKKIGTGMRIIAMNASVNAARIGAEGSSLGILAAGTQNLAVETADQIHRISEALRGIVESAQVLSGRGSAEAGEFLPETGELDAEFESMIERLQSADAYAGGALSEIETLSNSLLKEISATRKSFKSPDALIHAISDVCNYLESFIRRAKEHIPEAHAYAEDRHLRRLAARYTMKRERDVHQSVLHSAANPEAMPSGASAAAHEVRSDPALDNTDPLGDNVELF